MPLSVRVVSPEKVVYEGEGGSVVAPAWDGQVGILPGHAPMITLLGAGDLTIDLPGGGAEAWYVAGGALKVENDQVTVLTEFAGREAPEEVPQEMVFLPEDVDEELWESAGGPNPLI